MVTEVATIEEVTEFCNKVRVAGGANAIDSLMPGIPANSNSCLIAKNLNFNCEVEQDLNNWDGQFDKLGYDEEESVWTMTIRGSNAVDIGKKIEKNVEDIVLYSYEEHEYGGCEYKEAVLVIPAKIGRVANAFDEWVKNPSENSWLEPYIESAIVLRKDEIAEVCKLVNNNELYASSPYHKVSEIASESKLV